MLRSCSLSCSRYDLPPPPPVLEQLLEVGRTALRGGPVRDPDPEAHRARLERVRQARMSTQNQQPSRHASHLAQQQQQHSSEDCEEPGGHDTRVDAGGRGSSSSEQPAHVSVPDVVRQRRVREAFQHAWGGYTKHAWGTDELEPSQQRGVTSFGMGLTLVDSLDTLLLIMGNDSVEARHALEWIDHSLTIGSQEEVNVFEVTIRVLGGLLSAFEATGRASLLQKADALGQKMLFAFHTPHGLPYGTIGLHTRTRYNPTWSRGASTVAEVGTLQLEFRALSRHTGNAEYEAVASRIITYLRGMQEAGQAGQAGKAWPNDLPHGLYPMFISPETGLWMSQEVTLGARADSLYEYLLKQWLLSGRTDDKVRRMYDTSVHAIRAHLVRRGGAVRCGNCTYLARWNHRTKAYTDTMDHLACFVPGMLALGAHGATAAADLELAADLMETCYRMYADSPSGLAPEIAAFGHRSRVAADNGAKHFLLRPETSESLLIMWRVTGDWRYREWGWQIFSAIERHTRVPGGGYSPLKDVTAVPPPLDRTGRMESFFTAETLKYLYLLFGDGTEYRFDEYVFNTEAHPLRIRPEYAYGELWGSLPQEHELSQASDVPRPDAATFAAAAAGNRTAEAELEAADRAADELQALRGRVESRAALIRQIPTSLTS